MSESDGRRNERRTFEFESKVVGEMATFVVSSEEEERVGVPDLERPEVEYALCWERREGGKWRTKKVRTSMEK